MCAYWNDLMLQPNVYIYKPGTVSVYYISILQLFELFQITLAIIMLEELYFFHRRMFYAFLRRSRQELFKNIYFCYVWMSMKRFIAL